MGFNIKRPYGYREMWKQITDKITSAVDETIDWCNQTFSPKHDHPYDPAGSAFAVQKNLNDHDNNTTKHITATERRTWNGKSDKNHTHTTSQISGLDTAVKTICVGFPDYSNAEEISITLIDGYTVQKNGWLSVECIGSSGTVTVNGVVVAICHIYAGNEWALAQQSVFPVSKGDIVETTGDDRTNNVWFIPCK